MGTERTETYDDGLRQRVEEIIGLPVGESTARAFSVTMEPYVTLAMGGIKQEGDKFPCWTLTRGALTLGYLDAVREYARGKAGALYWRAYPTIIERREGDTDIDGRLVQPGWQIWSRLLISDKPAQQAA